MRQDFVQTVNAMTDTVDTAALGALIQSHVDEGMRLLEAAGVVFAGRAIEVALDMAYVGQTHTVAVPLPLTEAAGRVAAPERAQIAAAFDAAYTATYGRLLPGGVTRILNLRTAVIGKRPKFDLSSLAPQGEGSTVPRGTRQVHLGQWVEAAVYDRLALPVGFTVAGPAVLEQPDTTILIEPGLAGTADGHGNLILAPATPAPEANR